MRRDAPGQTCAGLPLGACVVVALELRAQRQVQGIAQRDFVLDEGAVQVQRLVFGREAEKRKVVDRMAHHPHAHSPDQLDGARQAARCAARRNPTCSGLPRSHCRNRASRDRSRPAPAGPEPAASVRFQRPSTLPPSVFTSAAPSGLDSSVVQIGLHAYRSPLLGEAQSTRTPPWVNSQSSFAGSPSACTSVSSRCVVLPYTRHAAPDFRLAAVAQAREPIELAAGARGDEGALRLLRGSW